MSIAHLFQLGNELAEERWSETIWGDRWVVTDTWLGYHWYVADFFEHEWDLERSRFRPDRSRTEHYREALRSLQLRSFQPTFVLCLDDGSGAFRQWFERSRETQSMEFDAPILRVRSAAYREAREGGRAALGKPGIDSWTDEARARFVQGQCELERQSLRDAVDEALAACSASRVGHGTT